MKYDILSYKGAGVILLGMGKQQVNTVLGNAMRTFRRTPFSKGDTEMYMECFVNYDANEKVDSIEFFGSACPTFKGKNLLSLQCNELRALFGEGEKEIRDNDSGFISPEYGISVYAPDEADDTHCLPEAIGIFVKGYFD